MKERLPVSKILIVDEQPIVRAGYQRFFAQEPQITEVGEAATRGEALTRLRESHWDLVVLDVRASERQDAELLLHIQRLHPDTKILVVSGLPECRNARVALRSGARGYVSKDRPVEELLSAVRTVLSGRRYISDTLAEFMASDIDGDRDKHLHEQLSSREVQVFARLAAGFAVSAIGREMGLSVKTISTYRCRILEKMGFKSNAEITAYALHHRIIP